MVGGHFLFLQSGELRRKERENFVLFPEDFGDELLRIYIFFPTFSQWLSSEEFN